jgi:glycosyltransferase involved in cell wall biosynthesis
MPTSGQSIVVLIPVYNDWASASLLLRDLGVVFRDMQITGEVLLVDDGSSVRMPPAFREEEVPGLRRIDVLELRRNLGHQRAIAVGLAFLHSLPPRDAVVVMDGDGEDKASDSPRLLDEFERAGRETVVFAERRRRSEGLTFRLFYALYRFAHRLLTGVSVRVGNFSVLPYTALDTLVVVSELWNHYAAAIFKSRVPHTTVPTVRGTRLAGGSQMRFAALVVHGLSALSVYGDLIGVRMLVALTILALAVGLGIALTIALRLVTSLAIPGWATYTTGLLFLILLQVMVVSVLFVFTILAGRANVTFIPLRDYGFFIRRVTRLGQNE